MQGAGHDPLRLKYRCQTALRRSTSYYAEQLLATLGTGSRRSGWSDLASERLGPGRNSPTSYGGGSARRIRVARVRQSVECGLALVRTVDGVRIRRPFIITGLHSVPQRSNGHRPQR